MEFMKLVYFQAKYNQRWDYGGASVRFPFSYS